MSSLPWIDSAIQKTKADFVTTFKTCYHSEKQQIGNKNDEKHLLNQWSYAPVTIVTNVTTFFNDSREISQNEGKSANDASLSDGFSIKQGYMIISDIEGAGYVLALEGDSLQWSHDDLSASDEEESFRVFIEQYAPVIIAALRERNKRKAK